MFHCTKAKSEQMFNCTKAKSVGKNKVRTNEHIISANKQKKIQSN